MTRPVTEETLRTIVAMKVELLQNVLVWIDRTTGQPMELKAHWLLEGFHSPQPSEVRDAAAVRALTAKSRPIIDAWNQSPADPNAGRYRFYAIRLVRQENLGSETHQNPITGERSWEGWGDGVGHVLFTID